MRRPETYDALDLLLDGGIVAYNRTLAHLVGDAAAALLLSQFLYWDKRIRPEREGWFYKSQEEIFEETALTRREQETSRRRLGRQGFLEEDRRGCPARLWFRVDREAIKQALQVRAAAVAQSDPSIPDSDDEISPQPVENVSQARMAEYAILDRTDRTSLDGACVQTVQQSNHQEITSSREGAPLPRPAQAVGTAVRVGSLSEKGTNGNRLDYDLPLRVYFGRPATPGGVAAVRKHVNAARKYGAYAVTQEDLNSAAVDARAWWQENRRGTPRGLECFCGSLRDRLIPLQDAALKLRDEGVDTPDVRPGKVDYLGPLMEYLGREPSWEELWSVARPLREWERQWSQDVLQPAFANTLAALSGCENRTAELFADLMIYLLERSRQSRAA